MASKVKIKIKDNTELRKEIDEIYEKLDQISLAKWAISISKHTLGIIDIHYASIEEIAD